MPDLTIDSDVDTFLQSTDQAGMRTAIGLGSVNNTSDSGKPVSTAQQTALDLKANLASPTFTGVPAVPTATGGTNTTQIASTAFVTAAITAAVTGLLDDKGPIDCAANPNYPVGLKGDCYRVTVAGRIGGGAGIVVEIGDLIICSADNAGGTQASVGTSWYIVQTNLIGAALTSGTLAQFAATTSSQLAGVLSDETGSGLAVFNTTPILAGATMTATLKHTEVTLTPTGTTQTVDLNAGNHQKLTLASTTGNSTVTLTVPSGASSGGTLIVIQHGTTPRAITWAVSSGTIRWCGTQPTWASDAASANRIVSWRWDGSVMYLASTEVAA